MEQPKPKYKTTEFWLTVVAMLASLALMTGFVTPGTAIDQGLGAIIAVLASLGYTYNRTQIKKVTDNVGSETAKKPGYKTTEFWGTALTTIATTTLASGALEGTESDKIIGTIAAGAAAMGYGPLRAQLKQNSSKLILFFALFLVACVPSKAVQERYKAVGVEYYTYVREDKNLAKKQKARRYNTLDTWAIDADLPLALWGAKALEAKYDKKAAKEKAAEEKAPK